MASRHTGQRERPEGRGRLSQHVAEELELDEGGHTLVEDVVDAVDDGDLDAVLLVDLFDTLGAVVAFGDHLHLELSTLDAVTLAYHSTEHMIAGEAAISGNQKVAGVDRFGDVACGLTLRIDAVDETLHLAHGIGHKDSLEVVAIFETRTNARSDGIDIFQDARELHANDVLADGGMHIVVLEEIGYLLPYLGVGATHGEIGESLPSYLLGMRGSRKGGKLLRLEREAFGQVLTDGDVEVLDDTLDDRDDHLVGERLGDLLYMLTQIGRRHTEDDHVGVADGFIDIVGEMDTIQIETHTRKVGGIVTQLLEFGDLLRVAHIPPDVGIIILDNLSDSCTPGATAEDGYNTGDIHKQII